MKKRYVKRVTAEDRFGWLELLVGLLFGAAAVMSFSRPSGFLTVFIVFIAVAALFRGISSTVGFFRTKKITGYRRPLLLLSGIFDIVIGGIFLWAPKTAMVAFGILFAIWFLISSVSGIVLSSIAKPMGRMYFWTLLLLNLLGLTAGIFLLVNPIVAAMTIPFIAGIYFLLFAVEYLLLAFRNNYY